MDKQRSKMTDRARQSAEKAAYVAVGAPTAALKAIGARVSDIRDTVRVSREELSGELSREIEEWVGQGEAVIEKALASLRESAILDELRSSTRSTRAAARIGLEKAGDLAGEALDLVAPDEDLVVVSGIGPSYAKKLHDAGVSGISSFLSKTSTRDERERLSARIGVSAEVVGAWRDQVDLTGVTGIGDAYQRLLNRVGVWTTEQLAESDPNALVEEMKSVSHPDVPDQLPSVGEVRAWKRSLARS